MAVIRLLLRCMAHFRTLHGNVHLLEHQEPVGQKQQCETVDLTDLHGIFVGVVMRAVYQLPAANRCARW